MFGVNINCSQLVIIAARADETVNKIKEKFMRKYYDASHANVMFFDGITKD